MQYMFACVCPHPVEIMDYISRVAPSEVRYGDSDLLVVVREVDANILLQFLASSEWSVHGVFIKHPAVKQVLLWHLCNACTNIKIQINKLLQKNWFCNLSWRNCRFIRKDLT